MANKITISQVNQKHLKIIGFLTASWALGLATVYITKNEYLIGLTPVINYAMYAIDKELKGEGYRQFLKK